jgi:DegV family protein with EDD domain
MLMTVPPAHADRPPVIVTDATCDLPPAVFQEFNIHVLRQRILFGEETYRTGVDMTTAQLFERMARGDVHPTTAPPPEEDFIQTYTALRDEGRPILSIHISLGLSETVLNARRAAPRLTGQSITVWDSKMTSGALGLQVLTAARAAKAGYTVDKIVPLLQQTFDRSNMFFCLNDLTNLHRGGRIGKVSFYVAQTLRLKPIITVSKEGQTAGTYISGTERPHTMQAAVDALFRHVAREIEPRGKLRTIILQSGDITGELAQQLAGKLCERFDCKYLEILLVAPVLAVHTGENALGITFVAGDWPV